MVGGTLQPHLTDSYQLHRRWIFILEGVLTCAISFFWFFAIPNSPEDAKWITPEERAFIKNRLAADSGKSALERRITPRDVLYAFKDYKYVPFFSPRA